MEKEISFYCIRPVAPVKTQDQHAQNRGRLGGGGGRGTREKERESVIKLIASFLTPIQPCRSYQGKERKRLEGSKTERGLEKRRGEERQTPKTDRQAQKHTERNGNETQRRDRPKKQTDSRNTQRESERRL